ncbi:MAG: efflux RND transporter permease subunit [Arcobacteraceae bacterium]|nr:efflux RND transporter permease subunit [Arcobacteraceae bacterium]
MYKLAINRPITTLMYLVALAIFGFMSFKQMPVALYPNVDFPIVTVKTSYPGADSTTVESSLTEKIEEAVSSIEGIDSITSISSDGVSVVTIKFFLEREISEATNDVRDKVSAIILPNDAKKPLVSKLDIGSASVINLFITPKGSTINELMKFVDEKLKPSIQKLNGVGAVNVIGYKDREIKIYPKAELLNKFGITIGELNQIIQTQNIKLGGGKLISSSKEYIIKTKADSLSIDELKNLKIKDSLRLQDIALVVDGLSDPQSFASYDGIEGVMLEIQKISGENTLAIIKSVKDTLPSLQKLSGDNYDLRLLNDTSVFIQNSIDQVKFDLLYGAILAIIIIFVFLRNITITLVSAVSIPASILGTFALMNYMGFDLNKMTLIGLTLSIGIIIDDAIVVLENIYKKIEQGMDRFQAAFEGTKEMAFAILAISAMLLAVFIPVSFMSGIVGKFFESFAMTVGFAVIISYTIALSLIPSLSARVLHKGESKFYDKTEPFFTKMESSYKTLLSSVLSKKLLVVVIIFVAFVGSLSLFPKIGMDFIPKEDKGEFEVHIKANSGVSLEQMIKQSKEVEQLLMKKDIVEYTTLSIGYNSAGEKHKALIYVKLSDKNQREVGQAKIIQDFRDELKQHNFDMFITAAEIPNIKGAGISVPYQIVLKSDSIESLQSATHNLTQHLKQKEGFVDIDTNLDDGKPQVDILIDREKANRLGVSAYDIANTILIAFSSDLEISKLEEDGKEYNITLRFDDENRQQLEDIKKLQVRSDDGKLILLDGLVSFENSESLASINRFDRQRQVTVMADLFGLDLGSAVSYTSEKIDELLGDDVSYRFTGFAEEMGKTISAFGVALSLSVILMYIILAILYESLIQPLIIMVALPLSIIGVLIALFLSGLQFSLFVMIGFMLLMGMVGKNAVLLVDFANSAIKDGMNIDEALLVAGQKRLRPILMTTFAMIFAMIPLAFGTGLGSEINSPMAISIIGGLISSMILTLFIVPILYKIANPLDALLKRFYQNGQVS